MYSPHLLALYQRLSWHQIQAKCFIQRKKDRRRRAADEYLERRCGDNWKGRRNLGIIWQSMVGSKTRSEAAVAFACSVFTYLLEISTICTRNSPRNAVSNRAQSNGIRFRKILEQDTLQESRVSSTERRNIRFEWGKLRMEGPKCRKSYAPDASDPSLPLSPFAAAAAAAVFTGSKAMSRWHSKY